MTGSTVVGILHGRGRDGYQRPICVSGPLFSEILSCARDGSWPWLSPRAVQPMRHRCDVLRALTRPSCGEEKCGENCRGAWLGRWGCGVVSLWHGRVSRADTRIQDDSEFANCMRVLLSRLSVYPSTSVTDEIFWIFDCPGPAEGDGTMAQNAFHECPMQPRIMFVSSPILPWRTAAFHPAAHRERLGSTAYSCVLRIQVTRRRIAPAATTSSNSTQSTRTEVRLPLAPSHSASELPCCYPTTTCGKCSP